MLDALRRLFGGSTAPDQRAIDTPAAAQRLALAELMWLVVLADGVTDHRESYLMRKLGKLLQLTAGAGGRAHLYSTAKLGGSVNVAQSCTRRQVCAGSAASGSQRAVTRRARTASWTMKDGGQPSTKLPNYLGGRP